MSNDKNSLAFQNQTNFKCPVGKLPLRIIKAFRNFEETPFFAAKLSPTPRKNKTKQNTYSSWNDFNMMHWIYNQRAWSLTYWYSKQICLLRNIFWKRLTYCKKWEHPHVCKINDSTIPQAFSQRKYRLVTLNKNTWRDFNVLEFQTHSDIVIYPFHIYSTIGFEAICFEILEPLVLRNYTGKRLFLLYITFNPRILLF